MNKKITKLFLALATSLTFTASAQQKCGTVEHTEFLKNTRPGYAKAMEKAEIQIQNWLAQHGNIKPKNISVVDTIPVVVHVVYNGNSQNISTAQIKSQIQILNEDYGRTNADAANTPTIWQSLSSSLPYRFVLARRKPDGSATTGIERTSTTHGIFNTNDDVKFVAQGGADAWDVNIYLNIWVCNLGNSLLGYGEFPVGTPSNTYGYVCNFTAFGNMGTAAAPFNLGRTTTHELGHCFDLYHIWGDDNGACSGSDNVNDTPNQSDATSGCFTFPHTDNCATTSPGIMFMNYMDYSDDNCLNMFTQGQASRMIAAVTNFYPTILNSIGVQAPTSAGIDAGISNASQPTGNTCNHNITPTVTISNFGNVAITTATIVYQIDNGTALNFTWTGNLAPSAQASVTLPVVNVVSGAHTFSVHTSAPNNGTDVNAANNSFSTSFTVAAAGTNLPLAQNFVGTFPASGYSVNNPDNNFTWQQNTTVGNGDNTSLSIDNFNNNNIGQIDEFVLPQVNLSNIQVPQLSFDIAYRLYTNPAATTTFSDTLTVLMSADCGTTFKKIYQKYSSELVTTNPVFDTAFFVPTAGQWRTETIGLQGETLSSSVIFKFRNSNDYENMMYIDNINISDVTGLNPIDLMSKLVAVYPNPAKDILNIDWTEINRKSNVSLVSISNIIGDVLYQKSINSGSKLALDISAFSAGNYMVQIVNNNTVINKRISIIK